MSDKNTDDPTSNYRGYAVSYTKGVIHVDPTTDKLHRDDHICNQQCRDLAARAQAEYWEDIRRTGGYLDKPVEATEDINYNTAQILAEPRMAIPESLRPKYGKLSETGRVQVTSEGKVEILSEATDDVWKEPKNAPKGGSGISKPKKTTDDIVDVSGESSIRRFLEEHTSVAAPGSWVGPSDEILSEWEKNRQDLEGIGLEDDDEDIIPDDKLLTHGDIPVIMGMLMDRLDITRFEFSYEEMLAFKGRVILDQSDSRKLIYMMIRQGK